MDLDTRMKTIEQTTGIKVLDFIKQYGNCYVDLFLHNKRVITNYENYNTFAYSKEEKRNTVEMQQMVVLGWIIEDFMCKQLGAVLHGSDKNREFGTITTEPDLKMPDGTLVEVKASFKNEIKEHGRFYIKQHSLMMAQKRGTTICIVDVINGTYQLINPCTVEVIGSSFWHEKVWLHIKVAITKMQKFKGGN